MATDMLELARIQSLELTATLTACSEMVARGPADPELQASLILSVAESSHMQSRIKAACDQMAKILSFRRYRPR